MLTKIFDEVLQSGRIEGDFRDDPVIDEDEAPVAADTVDGETKLLLHPLDEGQMAGGHQNDAVPVGFDLAQESAVLFREHLEPLLRVEEGAVKICANDFVHKAIMRILPQEKEKGITFLKKRTHGGVGPFPERRSEKPLFQFVFGGDDAISAVEALISDLDEIVLAVEVDEEAMAKGFHAGDGFVDGHRL